eukprot:GGOE01041670.1.p1 GENE.GGOE01041670.1~~GGOE01041670.1.p1  ORF type:complete len:211 (-),score=45.83 GGOE01041670.1:90-659(-)
MDEAEGGDPKAEMEPSVKGDLIAQREVGLHTSLTPSTKEPKVPNTTNDWTCGQCHNVNWARRKECNKCGLPRPKRTKADDSSLTICGNDSEDTKTYKKFVNAYVAAKANPGTDAAKAAMKAANKEWKKQKRDADYIRSVIQGSTVRTADSLSPTPTASDLTPHMPIAPPPGIPSNELLDPPSTDCTSDA